MRFTVLSLVVGLFALAVPGLSQAYQSQIFGLDRFGRPLFLPNAVCVYPGQELRIGADGVDDYGRRMYLPAERFLWRLSRGSGVWDQWSPSQTPYYGPFRKGGDFPDSIYVRVPRDIGLGRLEVQAQGLRPGVVNFVDANLRPSYYCEWASPEIYVGSQPQPPEPQPPFPPQPPQPEPTHTGTPGGGGHSPCYDRCQVSAACTDGCPRRGHCNYVNANPPYWRVLRCR